MKKLLAILLTMSLALALAVPAFAVEDEDAAEAPAAVAEEEAAAEEQPVIISAPAEEDEDVNRLDCWTASLQPGGEYARLAVARDCQNRGLAREMVVHILGVLKERGYRSVHILVNRDNIKAIRSYAHIGFRTVGECEMYNQHFLCYEKEL